MTRFRLIGNNGFVTEDYPEPDTWAAVLAHAGLTEFEYFADHLEPVLFRRVVERQSEFLQATRAAVKKHGLSVWSGATARVSYLMNLLSHPYADMRAEGVAWCCAFIDLALRLGARYISGHYDCLSKRDLDSNFEGAIERMTDGLVEVGKYAAGAGLEAIFLEQMHRPQLQPNTLERAHRILDALNARSPVPFHIHLDLGHAAPVFDDPTHTARDKDPYAWMAEPFGRNEITLVHAQQCDREASRHWPFTPQYNRRGIIDAGRCLSALAASGVGEAVIALEILFPRGTRIEAIEPDLVASAEYWRQALRAEGYEPAADGAWEKTHA